jgi:hypothetical protein
MTIQSTTITVRYVNQPKSPKGPGSVKDVNNALWKVWPDDLPRFREGGTYLIGYMPGTYAGKPDNTIKEVQDVTGGQLPSPPTAPQANGSFAAAPRPNGKYAPTDDATAERIFVCGAINAFAHAGTVKPNVRDVTNAVNALRAVYHNTLAKPYSSGTPGAEEGLDDEIPGF